MQNGERFGVSFSSTLDPHLDAVLVQIQDERHTIAEISDTCRFYGIKAHVIESDRLVGTVTPDGNFTASA
jgi:hypothetical protein